MVWQLLRGLLVVWLVLTLVFVAMRVLPGDALDATDSATSTAVQQQQREQLGLDKPLLHQYQLYLADLLRGRLGQSFITSENVGAMVLVRLGPTLALGLGSLGVALGLGLLLGVGGLANGIVGAIANMFLLLSQAVPFYLTALLALYFFSLRLNWLPASGSSTPLHLILPCGVLGFHAASSIAYVLQQNLRDVYQQPYMLTAAAKGLPPLDCFEHALRVALLPTLSVVAVQAGFLLSGTVVIEVMFVRRGLGSLLLDSVIERDYPVVQALAILGALFYLLATSASSILRQQLDPRPS